jgi:negative regulator of sigma E activity
MSLAIVEEDAVRVGLSQEAFHLSGLTSVGNKAAHGHALLMSIMQQKEHNVKSVVFWMNLRSFVTMIRTKLSMFSGLGNRVRP